MKIIDYKVFTYGADYLANVVNLKIKEGYSVYGTPLHTGEKITQAMVKYEEEDNSNKIDEIIVNYYLKLKNLYG